MSWEAVDDQAQILNSDALLQLICKIVKKHYEKMKHKKKY